MAKTINISGVIVSREYDVPVFSKWIDKGIITPSSRVLRAIEEANGEDLDIRVNSYGGDVLAGNEMLQAIQSYEGYACVTIGALAASMAANLVLCCGRRVEAYESSILLYHSARTVAEGGSGALEDQATMIEQINAPIKARLVAAGVPEDTVAQGFAEGRQYTMTGGEALALGIVDKVIGALPGSLPSKPGATDETRIAALADFTADFLDPAPADPPADEPVAEEAPVHEEAEAHAEPVAEEPAHAEAEPAPEAPAEPDIDALVTARTARIQSSAAKEINRLRAEHAEALHELEAKLADALARAESLSNELAQAKADLAAANARADAAVSRVLVPASACMEERAPTVSARDARRDLADKLHALPMAQREAYYRAAIKRS